MKHQKRFTLGKQERIKSRKVIQQLFREGDSFSNFPLRVIYIFSDIPNEMQAAFAVSKKYFKKAPDRNRIKRLMREAYRLQKPIFFSEENKTNGLQCMFIYTGNTLPTYDLIFEKIGKALETIQQ